MCGCEFTDDGNMIVTVTVFIMIELSLNLKLPRLGAARFRFGYVRF
jgi:hypothetical protein